MQLLRNELCDYEQERRGREWIKVPVIRVSVGGSVERSVKGATPHAWKQGQVRDQG